MPIKFLNTVAVDTSVLYVDTINDRVGIGTTSPSSLLHLSSAGSTVLNIEATGANDSRLRITAGNSNISYVEFADPDDVDTGEIRYEHATNNMQFRTAGNTERMRIDSSGNVGIGTAPDSDTELHVYRNGSAARVRVEREFNPKLDLESLNGYAQVGTLNNFPLAFQTNGSERIRVTSAGNVGIGTTSPGAKLDVNGAGNFSGGTVVSGIDTNTSVGVALAQGKYLYSDDGNYLRKLIGHNLNNSIDIGQGGTSLISDIKFFPGTSGNIIFYASGSENMRVNSIGNVGIGTTSPDASLTIKTGSSPGLAKISSDGNGAVYSANGDVQFYTNNSVYAINFFSANKASNLMRITNDGNVGIGTTSPGQKLEVNGNIKLSETAAATDTDKFVVLDSGVLKYRTGAQVRSDIGAGTGDITGVTAGTYLTGGGTSGNVTINADSTQLAHIHDSSNGTVAAGWITVAQASGARKAGEIYVTDGESSDHSYIRIEWMRSYADSNFTVLNCGGHANRIVGVRVLEETADKTYGKKYIQVKVTATSNYYVIVTAPGSIPMYGDFTAETPVLENTKTGYNVKGSQLENLQESSVGTDQGITVGGDLFVDGNVGIGTTSPNAKLQFDNGIDTRKIVLYQTANNDYQFYGFGIEGSTLVYSTLSQSDDHVFYAGLSSTSRREIMRVGGDGNVGIGTTSPARKLAVAGAIELTSADTTLHTGHPAIRRGNSGEMFLDAPGNISVTIDSNNNQTNAFFNVRKDTGTELFRVQENGNVGIGTTSPSHKFNVSSGNNTTAVGIDIGSSASFDFAANSTSGYTTLFYMDDTGLDIGHNSSGRSINFKTGGTDKLTILGGGNVGIGTTSPSQKLHVSGNARVTGAYYDSNNSAGTSGQVLSSTGTGTDWIDAGGGGGGISGTIATTQVAYGTGTDTIGGHSGLTYDGFGTLTATQIQCTSNLFVASSIYHYGDTNTRIGFGTDQIDLYAGSLRMITCDESTNDEVIINENSADINFRVESNTYTHMFFVDGGLDRVGINQSAPSYTLDVNGDAKISGTIVDSTNSAGSNNDVLTSTGSGWSWQPASGGGGIGGTLADDQVAFGNGTNTIAGSDDFAWNGNTLTLGGSTGTGNLSAVFVTGDGMTSNTSINLGTVIQHQGDPNTKFGFPANDTFTIETNGSERMRIDSSGNVGIGTTSPAYDLEVDGMIAATTSTANSASKGFAMKNGIYGTNKINSYYGAWVSSVSIYVGGYLGYSYQPIAASAFNVNSDYRLKSNVGPLENAISRLNQLEVHRFNWNDKLDDPKVDGFIAHEVKEIVPEAVTGEKDELWPDGNPKYQGIDQAKLVPLLTAALKEAITKIETLETRIQTLENK